MHLNISQQMKMSQQMKLAPRMIQSMEILQLPLMALQERIDQELEEMGLSFTRSRWRRLCRIELPLIAKLAKVAESRRFE